MTAPTLRRAAFVSLAVVLAVIVAVALTWPPTRRTGRAGARPDRPDAGHAVVGLVTSAR